MAMLPRGMQNNAAGHSLAGDLPCDFFKPRIKPAMSS